MDSSVVLSLAALTISIAAVAISLVLGSRQLRLMRHANYVPAVVDLLTQFRSRQFNDNFRFVIERLNEDHDPALGVSNLPDEARAAVYDVVYFYHAFVTLAALKIVNHDVLIALFHHRIAAAWRAVEPFVAHERETGPAGPHMLKLLQAFVNKHNGRVESNVEKMLSEQFRP